MKKNIFVLTALWSFLFIHHIALTQVRSTDRAVVFTKSGTGTSGYLLEIRIGTEDDTLVIVSTKGTELIQVGELSKIIILSREQEGNLFLAGAIVGTYISTLMIGHTDELPTGFLEQSYAGGAGLILTSALGILVGGGVGVFVNSGSNKELVLEFNRSAQENKAAREKLYGIFSNTKDIRKLHISVQGGRVYAHVKDEFEKVAGTNNYGMYGAGVSDFTMLRKIQLTFSADQSFEYGAAIQWSSEPKISRSSYTSSPDYSVQTSTGYEQLFTVTGYHAIGKYKPFVANIPDYLDIAVGGGVGIAKIVYRRGAGITTYNSTIVNGQYKTTTTETKYQYNVDKSMGSAVVFGECSFYLRDYLTLGLTADYSYFPPVTIPPEAAAGFPEQILSGNACFGFVLGFHL